MCCSQESGNPYVSLALGPYGAGICHPDPTAALRTTEHRPLGQCVPRAISPSWPWQQWLAWAVSVRTEPSRRHRASFPLLRSTKRWSHFRTQVPAALGTPNHGAHAPNLSRDFMPQVPLGTPSLSGAMSCSTALPGPPAAENEGAGGMLHWEKPARYWELGSGGAAFSGGSG